MFSKVLIANRGAIACRIIRTLRTLGIGSVAVYSEADRHSLHVAQADEAVQIGPAAAAQSYLSIDAILQAARETGAEAIHPGYGFLSENAEFADACEAAGIEFIGPTGRQMRAFALKHAARQMAESLQVPLLPGTGLLAGLEEARVSAEAIGYPVMLKSTAGGGGIGIRLCSNAEDLDAAWDAVARQGAANFGDGGAFLERFIARARHLEVQIFGDGNGEVVSLGERDCSAQRRNQKVIEETPAPGISPETRTRLCETAVRIGKAVDYRSAGTVEFVYDDVAEEFFFLEVNTRLQVEHGVTEEVTGVDLVAWMVLQASHDLAPLSSFSIKPEGHSFEARLYAEDAGRGFQPSIGRLTHVRFPEGVRVETWIEPGTEITPYYDPMIAKLIVRAADRPAALATLQILIISAKSVRRPSLAAARSQRRSCPGFLTSVLQLRLFQAGRKPRCRTPRGVLAIGMSEYLRPGRWIASPCGWRTGWSATTTERRAWRFPFPGRSSALAAKLPSPLSVLRWTPHWTASPFSSTRRFWLRRARSSRSELQMARVCEPISPSAEG